MCAGRSLSSENGSPAASTPSTNGPPGTKHALARRAAGPAAAAGGRAAPAGPAVAAGWRTWSRRAAPRAERPCAAVNRSSAGSALEQVEHPAADLVVEGPGLDRRQQRQRRAVGPAVLERVVQRVHVRRQHPGPGRVAAAQQPQLFLLADVGEVPDQRAHQRVVLGQQVGSSRSVSASVQHGPVPGCGRRRHAWASSSNAARVRPPRCARQAGHRDTDRTRPARRDRPRRVRAQRDPGGGDVHAAAGRVGEHRIAEPVACRLRPEHARSRSVASVARSAATGSSISVVTTAAMAGHHRGALMSR